MIRKPRRLARWAAILLPIVAGARVVLLVFQLHGEREDRWAKIPPAWPASPGEALRFRADNPAIRRWARPAHMPLAVALLKRGFMVAAAEQGCMLDPIAMARHGGTLTLLSQDASTDWRARWSGGASMLSLDELGAADPDRAARLMEAALIAAADCGGEARLSLTMDQVHALVSLIADQPLPAPSATPRHRILHIPVNAPPP